MRSIDNRVRDLAIRELERDGGASLAINISGLTATERSWFRGLVARLKERRDIATRLIVEITETAALQDIDETSRFVSALRALGCKVALDDFGRRRASSRRSGRSAARWRSTTSAPASPPSIP